MKYSYVYNNPDDIAYLREGIAKCIKNGKVKLHSGQYSYWIFDALNYIETWSDYVRALIKNTHSISYLNGALVGIEFGGAILTSLMGDYNGIIRKDGKYYVGKRRYTNIILVDDVVTTGASLEAAEKVLVEHGHIITDRFCILNRSGGRVKCKSLLTFEEPPI